VGGVFLSEGLLKFGRFFRFYNEERLHSAFDGDGTRSLPRRAPPRRQPMNLTPNGCSLRQALGSCPREQPFGLPGLPSHNLFPSIRCPTDGVHLIMLRSSLQRLIAVFTGGLLLASFAPATAWPSGPIYVFSHLAGPLGGNGNVDGTGQAARFFHPYGVAVDGAGNIYVADTQNFAIRRITPSGVVTTLAPTLLSSGYFWLGTGPTGVAVDKVGNIYVASDSDSTIRKISSDGVVAILAGDPVSYGSADGTGAAAQFYQPHAIAVDSTGTAFVADSGNNTIRKITPAGDVTTLAGTPGVYGSADGTGAAAQFNFPTGLALDSAGNIYVADFGNYAIRKVTSNGVVTTLAGTAGVYGSSNGTGTAALFKWPAGVAVDNGGNIYVADEADDTIRKITPGGVVTTLAGISGVNGWRDGAGTTAQFSGPTGVAVNSDGTVYAADNNNSTIREISPAGVVTTLAGMAAIVGTKDGSSTTAQFSNPTGVTVDSGHNVYVADQLNATIRKIAAAGQVTTLAGTPGVAGSTDGNGSAALFFQPSSVAVDSGQTI
jgi:sugar lactone lactonase YvrE